MGTDYTRGGRGKQAPYTTTHCRIPEPIKVLVDQLTAMYKQTLGNKSQSEANRLVNSLQYAISEVSFKRDFQERFRIS